MLDKLEASDFSPWLNQTMPDLFNPDVWLPAELAIQVRESTVIHPPSASLSP